MAGATVSWCFESSSRGHHSTVVHTTGLLWQGGNTALACLSHSESLPVYETDTAVQDAFIECEGQVVQSAWVVRAPVNGGWRT